MLNVGDVNINNSLIRFSPLDKYVDFKSFAKIVVRILYSSIIKNGYSDFDRRQNICDHILIKDDTSPT